MPLPIATVFADLPDPRSDTANKLHTLNDILTIALCATIGGANGWEQIAEYGRRKEAFFRHYKFQSPAFLKEVMDSYVARALQTRNLFA